MSDTTQHNAMAEIALALAMGFFSIMVLTMVSMGSGLTPASSSGLDKKGAELGRTPDRAAAQKDADTQKVDPDNLVIFFEGKYKNARLEPVSTASLAERSGLVLALDPLLPMSEALKARERIAAPGVTVVALDDQWLARLEEKTP